MRLNSLDYLRGIAAVGIVVYHFSSWTFGDLDAASFLSRFGLYGVSLFYMLSGLTLFYVYENKLFIYENIRGFLMKRAVRIFPLLWLVTFLTILGAKMHFGIGRIFLNITGLFSILSPRAYIAGGAWSIGNELCFYLLFPLLLFCYKRNSLAFLLLVIGSLIVHIFLGFSILNPTINLEQQWISYINPFNQLFYFVAGILIFIFSRKVLITRSISFIIFILGLLLFIFYPVSGNKVNLIFGMNKLIFTIICILIVYGCLGIKSIAFMPVHNLFNWLGEISYSVYLLHPIVWKVISLLLIHFNLVDFFAVKFITGLGLTFALSHFIYSSFELRASNLGKKLMKSVSSNVKNV